MVTTMTSQHCSFMTSVIFSLAFHIQCQSCSIFSLQAQGMITIPSASCAYITRPLDSLIGQSIYTVIPHMLPIKLVSIILSPLLSYCCHIVSIQYWGSTQQMNIELKRWAHILLGASYLFVTTERLHIFHPFHCPWLTARSSGSTTGMSLYK